MIKINPLIQPPGFLTKLFPEAVWRIENNNKQVYLTFDDGPIPVVTPWVIDLLAEYSIKSTFFCVGENVAKYPGTYEQLLNEGHAVGNHTFSHLQGLKSENADYFLNIEKAARLIDSKLFRPPHGLITRSQYRYLKGKYDIVMWDLLSCDSNSGISDKKVMKNVFSFVRPGSIITFHDSVRSFDLLKKTLPVVIKKLKDEGYSFLKIEQEKIKALSSRR